MVVAVNRHATNSNIKNKTAADCTWLFRRRPNSLWGPDYLYLTVNGNVREDLGE